jgi:hypothetical protein
MNTARLKTHRRQIPWIVMVPLDMQRTLLIVHPPMAAAQIIRDHLHHGSPKRTTANYRHRRLRALHLIVH